MPKTTTPDAAVYARWLKLQRLSEDQAGKAEGKQAATAAAQMVVDHPWLPAYHKHVTQPPEPEIHRTAGSSHARDIAAAVFAAAVSQAKQDMPNIAANLVSNLSRRADSALGDFIMPETKTAKPKTNPGKAADRKTTAELLDDIEVSGVILGSEEGDLPGTDVVALSFLLSEDQAAAILTRTEDDSNAKLAAKIGSIVLAALAEVLDNSECGEWPWGEDDGDAEGEEGED